MTISTGRPDGRHRAGASRPFLALCFALSLATAGPAGAEAVRAGRLTIDHAWARETAAGQSAGGGFLTIANAGRTDDRLTGGTMPLAAEVQVHSMRTEGGVMRMRRLADGLVIPAGGTATLQPGGLHIMFMGLKRPLKRGETVPVTLHFARAGKVTVRFAIEAISHGRPGHGAH